MLIPTIFAGLAILVVAIIPVQKSQEEQELEYLNQLLDSDFAE